VEQGNPGTNPLGEQSPVRNLCTKSTKRPAALLVALVTLLCGCGGGGSGSSGATPQQIAVLMTWTGVTHSTTQQFLEPIELGVTSDPGTIQAHDAQATNAQVQVSVFPQSAGPAKLQIADTTVATIDKDLFVHANAAPGVTVLTASVRSGVSMSSYVLVYPRIAIACGATQPPESAPGYAFSSGTPVAVTTPQQADIYLVGPACPGAFHYPRPIITVTRQIALIPKSEPISLVKPGPPLQTSTWGFSIFSNQQQPMNGFAFKSASSRNVKFQVTRWCAGTNNLNCGYNEYLTGIYQISDTSGNWAY
jgi:hypothetical protein